MKAEAKVKAFYQITIGMDGMADESFGRMLASKLFQLPPKASINALDRIWNGIIDLSYRSALTHFDVIEHANEIMAEYPNVLSMDITYQFPYDFAPGRTYLYQNEAPETFTGKIEWI